MYLQKHLAKDFSPGVRQRGFAIHEARKVTLLSGDAREVSAKVRGSATYHVDLSRVGDEIHVSCECAYFDSEPVCKHIWATILAADEKFYLLGVGGGPPRLAWDLDDDELEDEDEDGEDQQGYFWNPGKDFRPVKTQAPPPKIPAWRTLLQQMNNARRFAGTPPPPWSA